MPPRAANLHLSGQLRVDYLRSICRRIYRDETRLRHRENVNKVTSASIRLSRIWDEPLGVATGMRTYRGQPTAYIIAPDLHEELRHPRNASNRDPGSLTFPTHRFFSNSRTLIISVPGTKGSDPLTPSVSRRRKLWAKDPTPTPSDVRCGSPQPLILIEDYERMSQIRRARSRRLKNLLTLHWLFLFPYMISECGIPRTRPRSSGILNSGRDSRAIIKVLPVGSLVS